MKTQTPLLENVLYYARADVDACLFAKGVEKWQVKRNGERALRQSLGLEGGGGCMHLKHGRGQCGEDFLLLARGLMPACSRMVGRSGRSGQGREGDENENWGMEEGIPAQHLKHERGQCGEGRQIQQRLRSKVPSQNLP